MTHAVCRDCGFHFSGQFDDALRAIYRHLVEERYHCVSGAIIGKYDIISVDASVGAGNISFLELLRHKTVAGVRDEVVDFARAMEDKLKANDHKEHWRGQNIFSLFKGLQAEVEELQAELNGYEESENITGAEIKLLRIQEEAVDVANFAMMVWDRAGILIGKLISRGR